MPSEEIQQPDTAQEPVPTPSETVEETADNEEQDYVHIEWAGYI